MLKRFLSVMLALTLLISTSVPTASAAEAAASTGLFLLPPVHAEESEEPYTPISSAADFSAIFTAPDQTYILMNDIELTDWQTDENMVFSGTLYGNGHTISYRTSGRMSHSSVLEQGLFYSLDGAVISDLHVRAEIENSCYGIENSKVFFGGIAAHAKGSVIVSNCTVDARICISTVEWHNPQRTGFTAQSAPDASALGDMGANSGVGGFIGMVDADADLYMQYCRAQGVITGLSSVGGLIGSVQGSITDLLGCENLAEVTGLVNVGGLIGCVPAQTSGYCAITACANRGLVWALTSCVGGLLGRGSGSISMMDCANAGNVIAGAMTAAGAKAGQIAGETDGEIVRAVLAGTVIPAAQEAVPSADPMELDSVYVWAHNQELGIEYPLALMGSKMNVYRASYVQGLRDLLADMSTQGIRHYVSTVNPAGTLGASYRTQGIIPSTLSEANEMWNFLNVVNDVLGFDVSALDDLDHYDVLLADLLMTQQLQTASSSIGRDTLIDIASYVTASTDLVNSVSGVSSAVIDAAKTTSNVMEHNIRTDILRAEIDLMRAYSSQYDYWGMLDDFSDLADMEIDSASSLLDFYTERAAGVRKAGETLDNTGKTLSTIGTIINTLSVFFKNMEQAAIDNAVLDIYNASYDRIDHVISAMIAGGVDIKSRYPEFVDAAGNISKLKAALEKLQDDALNQQNISQEAARIKAAAGSGFLSALVPLGALGETVLLKSAVGSKLAGWQLYKGAASLGMLVGDLIGSTDAAYYGCMLNCASYAADLLEEVVRVHMNTFLVTGTYEDAVRFCDVMSMYFSLQVLACDYALSYDEVTKQTSESDLHELRMIKSDLLTILESIRTLP